MFRADFPSQAEQLALEEDMVEALGELAAMKRACASDQEGGLVSLADAPAASLETASTTAAAVGAVCGRKAPPSAGHGDDGDGEVALARLCALARVITQSRAFGKKRVRVGFR